MFTDSTTHSYYHWAVIYLCVRAIDLFLRFWYLILELFRHCDICILYFIYTILLDMFFSMWPYPLCLLRSDLLFVEVFLSQIQLKFCWHDVKQQLINLIMCMHHLHVQRLYLIKYKIQLPFSFSQYHTFSFWIPVCWIWAFNHYNLSQYIRHVPFYIVNSNSNLCFHFAVNATHATNYR